MWGADGRFGVGPVEFESPGVEMLRKMGVSV